MQVRPDDKDEEIKDDAHREQEATHSATNSPKANRPTN
jgi:hypothetical protein